MFLKCKTVCYATVQKQACNQPASHPSVLKSNSSNHVNDHLPAHTHRSLFTVLLEAVWVCAPPYDCLTSYPSRRRRSVHGHDVGGGVGEEELQGRVGAVGLFYLYLPALSIYPRGFTQRCKGNHPSQMCHHGCSGHITPAMTPLPPASSLLSPNFLMQQSHLTEAQWKWGCTSMCAGKR